MHVKNCLNVRCWIIYYIIIYVINLILAIIRKFALLVWHRTFSVESARPSHKIVPFRNLKLWHLVTMWIPVSKARSADVARSASMPKSTVAKSGAAVKRVESTPAGKRKYWWPAAEWSLHSSCFAVHVFAGSLNFSYSYYAVDGVWVTEVDNHTNKLNSFILIELFTHSVCC